MDKRFVALTLTVIAAAIIVVVATVGYVYAHKGDELYRGCDYGFMKHSRVCTSNATSATYVGRSVVWMHGFRGGRGMLKQFVVEVSDEYRAKVESILRSDPDVSALLEKGYNITAIKPIVKLVVQGNGSVVASADKATVILVKNGGDRAIVYVDVASGSVIEIVKCERISKTAQQLAASSSVATQGLTP